MCISSLTRKIYILLLILINGITNINAAQTEQSKAEVFSLTGEVYDADLTIPGVVLNFYVNNEKVESIETNSNGIFDLKLLHNTVYVIDVLKVGYIPTKVILDTKVTNEVINSGGIGETFDFTISIVKEYSGINIDAFANPIVYYYFNSRVGWFFDPDPRRSKMAVISQTNRKISQEINKEVLKYQREGDKFLTKKQTDQAFVKYLEAFYLNHDNNKSKDKVEKLLGDLRKDNKIDKIFEEFIEKADAAFEKHDLNEAHKYYFFARTINSKDKYIKSKIDQIKASKEETFMSNRLQFDNLMYVGLNKENDKNYQEALNNFTNAIKLFPNDPWAKAKIIAVNKMLKGEKENIAPTPAISDKPISH